MLHYYYICVRILLLVAGRLFRRATPGAALLLYMCPHTTISSRASLSTSDTRVLHYYYICVRILLLVAGRLFRRATPGAALILPPICVSPYYYICVLVLICTSTYTSSYYYACILILLHVCTSARLLRRATRDAAPILLTICVSPYYYTCVLILLHVCTSARLFRRATRGAARKTTPGQSHSLLATWSPRERESLNRALIEP